jgi:hypothetical protein
MMLMTKKKTGIAILLQRDFVMNENVRRGDCINASLVTLFFTTLEAKKQREGSVD